MGQCSKAAQTFNMGEQCQGQLGIVGQVNHPAAATAHNTAKHTKDMLTRLEQATGRGIQGAPAAKGGKLGGEVGE